MRHFTAGYVGRGETNITLLLALVKYDWLIHCPFPYSDKNCDLFPRNTNNIVNNFLTLYPWFGASLLVYCADAPWPGYQTCGVGLQTERRKTIHETDYSDRI